MSHKQMQFRTETQKLLHLVIHSLYSHTEIFLREVLSNASDAIDKMRFTMLSDAALAAETADFAIRITPDEKAGTLTISDNGIGMTEEELVENLGTIARSGTGAFIEAIEDKGKYGFRRD